LTLRCGLKNRHHSSPTEITFRLCDFDLYPFTRNNIGDKHHPAIVKSAQPITTGN
jgi:hypothetical protein